ALLSSIPVPDPNNPNKGSRIILEGDVPSPINPKPGCRFASRCRYSNSVVTKEDSFSTLVGKHLYSDIIDPSSREILAHKGELVTPEIVILINSNDVKEVKIRREKCFDITPELEEIRKDHFTACHYIREINKDLL
ncbi:MAG: hypothetical protein KAH16_04905, partial [Candidatus Izimaplasma sp.]|nr:hypothetical protein [Candidatus Izimaplasma bacterium]